MRIEAKGDQDESQSFVLPAAAVRLLADIMTHLAQGRRVAVLPDDAELTTKEAADLLNVSHRYLVGLLQAGKLPHHIMVGTYRRVFMRDLLDYRRRQTETSGAAMDELAAQAQELGMDYWRSVASVALLDACVLYRAPLRDLLLRLACTGLFRARWSNQIHEEWTRSVLRARPELAAKLLRTRSLMDQAVEDALVIGHEPLISELVLPDPDDRHVLAAAIRGRADVIVTFNIKHFPGELLAPFRIETRHPNLFIRDVLDLNEAVALGAVIGHRGSLRHPAFSAEEYLDLLLGAVADVVEMVGGVVSGS